MRYLQEVFQPGKCKCFDCQRPICIKSPCSGCQAADPQVLPRLQAEVRQCVQPLQVEVRGHQEAPPRCPHP